MVKSLKGGRQKIAPPKPQDTVGNLSRPPRDGRAWRANGRVLSWGTKVTAQFKRDFNMAAAQHGYKKVELLELMLEHWLSSDPSTQKKSLPFQKKKRPLPQDQEDGRLLPLDLYGTSDMKLVIDRLSAFYQETPSAFLERLLAEHWDKLTEQGIKIDLFTDKK